MSLFEPESCNGIAGILGFCCRNRGMLKKEPVGIIGFVKVELGLLRLGLGLLLRLGLRLLFRLGLRLRFGLSLHLRFREKRLLVSL